MARIAGRRVKRRAKGPQHHRMRALRLQTCPAVAGCRARMETRLSRKLLCRRKTQLPGPCRGRPGMVRAVANRQAGNSGTIVARSIAAICWILAAVRDFSFRQRSIGAGRPKALSHRVRQRQHARSLGASVTEGFFGADDGRHAGPGLTPSRLTNMLEHVPDPIVILELARDLLRPGGALSVGVPNDFSPFQIAAARRRPAPMIGGWRHRIISITSIFPLFPPCWRGWACASWNGPPAFRWKRS